MSLFGIELSGSMAAVFIAVVVLVIAAIIAIPIYKGYKDEMKKASKKKGSRPSSSAKKSSGTRR